MVSVVKNVANQEIAKLYASSTAQWFPMPRTECLFASPRPSGNMLNKEHADEYIRDTHGDGILLTAGHGGVPRLFFGGVEESTLLPWEAYNPLSLTVMYPLDVAEPSLSYSLRVGIRVRGDLSLRLEGPLFCILLDANLEKRMGTRFILKRRPGTMVIIDENREISVRGMTPATMEKALEIIPPRLRM